MLAISAPSGCGKTTVARAIASYLEDVELSISCTTRSPRGSEMSGKDYFFMDDARFREMIDQDLFLEHATVFDYLYGTPVDFVQKKINAGIDVIFDIDWQGVAQIKSKTDDLVSIFMLPPSLDELRNRLIKRGMDSDSVISRRLNQTRREIQQYHMYDYVIVNQSLDDSICAVKNILSAERIRQVDIQEFIDSLLKV